jgi:hypothetical protein
MQFDSNFSPNAARAMHKAAICLKLAARQLLSVFVISLTTIDPELASELGLKLQGYAGVTGT